MNIKRINLKRTKFNKFGELFSFQRLSKDSRHQSENKTVPESNVVGKKVHAIYLSVIFILVILIFFLTSNGSFAGKAIASFDKETGTYCQDLDREDFEISGITTIYDKDSVVIDKRNDYCDPQGFEHILVEVSCDGSRANFLEEKTLCPDGCKDGACIPHGHH